MAQRLAQAGFEAQDGAQPQHGGTGGIGRMMKPQCSEIRHGPEPRKPDRDMLALLTLVLRGQPHLDGAACRHRASLFDAAASNLLDYRAVATAAEVCERCPVTAQCARFAQQDGATGVFAGMVFIEGRAFTIEDWLSLR